MGSLERGECFERVPGPRGFELSSDVEERKASELRRINLRPAERRDSRSDPLPLELLDAQSKSGETACARRLASVVRELFEPSELLAARGII